MKSGVYFDRESNYVFTIENTNGILNVTNEAGSFIITELSFKLLSINIKDYVFIGEL